MPRRSPPAARLLVVSLIMTAAAVIPATSASAVDLFTDDFESNSLAAWDASTNFTVQSAIKNTGTYAGRATASSGSAFVSKTLATGQTDVYLRSFVHVVSHNGTIPLLRMGSATNSLVSLNLNTSDQLIVRNLVAAQTRQTGVTMALGSFVELQLHLHIGGTSGFAEVWVNGTKATAIDGAWDFGTAQIGKVALGVQASGSTAALDVVFDDVIAATTMVGGGGGDPTAPPTPTGLGGTAFYDHIDLSWNPSSGADGYTVYRGGVLLASTTGTSLTDNTVLPNTTYSYTVDAYNTAGRSAPSGAVQFTTPPAPSGEGIVVRAAGDIACDPSPTHDPDYNGGNGTATKCRQKYTARLLGGTQPADQVFSLGDAQYLCGGLAAYNQVYDPTWGVYKAITHPILSDEDYDTTGTDCGAAGADGYFSYFGSRLAAEPGNTAEDPTKGYYSFELGPSWHVVALNSECVRIPGGCAEGGAQNNWLEADLAASTKQCEIALLHAPLFSSKGSTGTVDGSVRPLVQDLYEAGVEMVLSGDKHFYERFRPQDHMGKADPNGIVQWIIGTGGKSLTGLTTFRRPNSAIATKSTFGVLELTLNNGSYGWDFIVEGSSSFTDTGAATCH